MIHRLWIRPTKDQHGDTIWLTIYADMITNLVLLFLALYGLMMMGNDSLVKAVQSMRYGELKKTQDLYNPNDLKTLPDKLREELKGESGVTVRDDLGAVRIEFGESLLFSSGQAKTKDTATHVLNKVSRVIADVPFTVIVEGHTDNVPLSKKSAYKNNRELSMARAMSIVRWFIQEGKINPSQFAAAAYGEFKPRASNLTLNGRRMNRRVELLLMKDFMVPSRGQ